jgi:hypothetical protein
LHNSCQSFGTKGGRTGRLAFVLVFAFRSELMKFHRSAMKFRKSIASTDGVMLVINELCENKKSKKNWMKLRIVDEISSPK